MLLNSMTETQVRPCKIHQVGQVSRIYFPYGI